MKKSWLWLCCFPVLVSAVPYNDVFEDDEDAYEEWVSIEEDWEEMTEGDDVQEQSSITQGELSVFEEEFDSFTDGSETRSVVPSEQSQTFQKSAPVLPKLSTQTKKNTEDNHSQSITQAKDAKGQRQQEVLTPKNRPHSQAGSSICSKHCCKKHCPNHQITQNKKQTKHSAQPQRSSAVENREIAANLEKPAKEKQITAQRPSVTHRDAEHQLQADNSLEEGQKQRASSYRKQRAPLRAERKATQEKWCRPGKRCIGE